MDPLLAKVNARLAAREVIRRLPAAERARQSAELTTRLLASSEWAAARRVLLFVPLPDEPNLSPMISAGLAAGKTVGLPTFDVDTGGYGIREIREIGSDLVPGRFRIPEPGAHCRRMTATELDYALVPGLAFDVRGGRLGRGKGFYDRLLARASGLLCGVGFNEQLGSAVPVEAHDRFLHRVFTAAQFLDCVPSV